MDLARIKEHGRSRTRKGWVTNPLRALLWWLMVPYLRALSAEITRCQPAVRASAQTDLEAVVTGRLGGIRKDAMAMAHRLAGLEEEAAATVQACSVLRTRLDSVEAAAASVRQDVDTSVRILNARIDAMAHNGTLRTGDRIAVGQDGMILVGVEDDTRFLVRDHDLIGRNVAGGREWEPHVRAVIERAANRDGVAVDVGAYIGLHTVTMSRLFGAVHAFEPQRGIYHLLCANLAINRCINVAAHNLALYDRAGFTSVASPDQQVVPAPMVDGHPDDVRIPNASGLTFDPVSDGPGDVRAATLDSLELDRVALIKVDTEGADLRALRGAEHTIRRCRPLVIFEWHKPLAARHGVALDDYHAFFAAMDYDVAMIHETLPGREADYLATPR